MITDKYTLHIGNWEQRSTYTNISVLAETNVLRIKRCEIMHSRSVLVGGKKKEEICSCCHAFSIVGLTPINVASID